MTNKKPFKNARWSADQGVTILEILIVLAIIALLASVVAPRVIGYLGAARSDTAVLQIANLKSAVQMFYIDTGRYPSEAEGLPVLMVAPAGERSWNGPYMQSQSALIDPWSRDYMYEMGDGENFVIKSFGRDGTQGGVGEDSDFSN